MISLIVSYRTDLPYDGIHSNHRCAYLIANTFVYACRLSFRRFFFSVKPYFFLAYKYSHLRFQCSASGSFFIQVERSEKKTMFRCCTLILNQKKIKVVMSSSSQAFLSLGPTFNIIILII